MHVIKIIEFDKNETIAQEGKAFDKLGILLKGKVQSVQYDYLGNRTIVSDVEPLQIFGEAFSCIKTKLPVNIETTQKCKVLFLISDKISNPCSNGCMFHKQLINNLLHILANKNVNLTQKNRMYVKKDYKRKIANLFKFRIYKTKFKRVLYFL